MDNSFLWIDVYKAIGAKYHPFDKYVDPCVDAVLACQRGEPDTEIYLDPRCKISLPARIVVANFELERFAGGKGNG